jgi:hypothetical protein
MEEAREDRLAMDAERLLSERHNEVALIRHVRAHYFACFFRRKVLYYRCEYPGGHSPIMSTQSAALGGLLRYDAVVALCKGCGV